MSANEDFNSVQSRLAATSESLLEVLFGGMLLMVAGTGARPFLGFSLSSIVSSVLVVLALIAPTAIIRGSRVAVIRCDDRLKVRNPWRTHSVPIRSATVVGVRNFPHGWVPFRLFGTNAALVLSDGDGREIIVVATAVSSEAERRRAIRYFKAIPMTITTDLGRYN